MNVRHAAVIAVLSLLGCTADDHENPGRGGERAVDAGAIAIDAVTRLSIGNESAPEYQFSGVVTAHRLGTGEFLVADRGSRQLRFYDAAGKYVRSAGGSGEGPGEFRDVTWADVAADGSIVVYDERLRQLSRFSAGGALTRTWRVIDAPDGANLRPVGFLAAQSLVWSSWTHPTAEQNPVGSVFRTTSSYLSAEISDTQSELDPATFQLLAQQPGQRNYAHDLAGPDSRILAALAFTPTPLAVAAHGRLYLAASDSLTVIVYDARGQQVSHIAERMEPAVVAGQDVSALQEQLVQSALAEAGGRIAESDVRQFYARLFVQMPVPERKPAIDALIVDAAGDIWVRRYRVDQRGATAATWWVFSSDGQRIAQLTLPSNLVVFEIGTDEVIGVQRDEMGIEQVQRYKLTRSR